jgi:hypothetical protein
MIKCYFIAKFHQAYLKNLLIYDETIVDISIEGLP